MSEIAHLIVDNEYGYSFKDVKKQIKAFANVTTESGATAKSIF